MRSTITPRVALGIFLIASGILIQLKPGSLRGALLSNDANDLAALRKGLKGPTRAAEEAASMIHEAMRTHASEVRIEAKDLYFGESLLNITGAVNIRIVFHPARGAAFSTLWFKVGGGVLLEDCTNVTLEGVAIDFAPTVAQGRVVSIGSVESPKYDAFLLADFDPRFLNPSAMQDSSRGHDVKVALFHPGRHLNMVRPENSDKPINIWVRGKAEPVAAGIPHSRLRFKVPLKQHWATLLTESGQPHWNMTGYPVALWEATGRHSLTLKGCTEVTVMNVTIFGGSNMGVVEKAGRGGNRFIRVRVDRRPAPWADGAERYLSVNGDGFHSVALARGPLFVESHVGFVGEDCVNVRAQMHVLIGLSSDRETAYLSGDPFDVGKFSEAHDTVSFFDFRTMEHLADATIAGVPSRDSSSSFAGKLRKAFSTMQSKPTNAKFVASVGTDPDALGGTAVVRVPLVDAVPKGVPTYALATLSSTSNTRAVVKDSDLHDCYGRGVGIKAGKFRLEDCKLSRAAGVQIGPRRERLEGQPDLRDVRITGCTLSSLGRPIFDVDRSIKTHSAAALVLKPNRVDSTYL